MVKLKQIIGVALMTTLSVTLFAGCGKGDGKLKGKYVESDFNLPKNVEIINNLEQLDNGDIALIGYPKIQEGKNQVDYLGKEQLLYVTKDNGASWEEKLITLPAIEDGMVRAWSNSVIKSDGELIVSSTIMSKENLEKLKSMKTEDQKIDGGQVALDENLNDEIYKAEKVEMYHIDKEGKAIRLNVNDEKNKLNGDMKIDSDGNVYINDFEEGKIKQLDGKTLEVKKEFETKAEGKNKSISSWFISGKSIYLSNTENIYEFNIETGEDKGKVTIDEAVIKNSNGIYPGKDGICYAVSQNGVSK